MVAGMVASGALLSGSGAELMCGSLEWMQALSVCTEQLNRWAELSPGACSTAGAAASTPQSEIVATHDDRRGMHFTVRSRRPGIAPYQLPVACAFLQRRGQRPTGGFIGSTHAVQPVVGERGGHDLQTHRQPVVGRKT